MVLRSTYSQHDADQQCPTFGQLYSQVNRSAKAYRQGLPDLSQMLMHVRPSRFKTHIHINVKAIGSADLTDKLK